MCTGQLPFKGADMVATLIAVASTQRPIAASGQSAGAALPVAAHHATARQGAGGSPRLRSRGRRGRGGNRKRAGADGRADRPRHRRADAAGNPPASSEAALETIASAVGLVGRRERAGGGGAVAVLAVVLLMKRPAPDTKRMSRPPGHASADFNRGTAGDPHETAGREKPPPPGAGQADPSRERRRRRTRHGRL